MQCRPRLSETNVRQNRTTCRDQRVATYSIYTITPLVQAAEAYMASISEVHGIVKKRGGRAPAKTARLKAALADKRLHVVPNLGGAGG